MVFIILTVLGKEFKQFKSKDTSRYLKIEEEAKIQLNSRKRSKIRPLIK